MFTKEDEQQLKIFELAGQELNKASSDIYEKVRSLRAKKKIADNTPLIGKYFTFSNSYSPHKSWTEYVKVTGVNGYGDLIGQQFSKDSDGNIEFKSKHDVNIISMYITENRVKKITQKQYEKERAKLLKEGGFI